MLSDEARGARAGIGVERTQQLPDGGRLEGMRTRSPLPLPPLAVPSPVVDWLAKPILHGFSGKDSTVLARTIVGNDSGEAPCADAPPAGVTVEILEDAITLEDEGIKDLQRFAARYQATLGSGAPPFAHVLQVFTAGSQWSSSRVATEIWDGYASAQ